MAAHHGGAAGVDATLAVLRRQAAAATLDSESDVDEFQVFD
jgi:hypothetical protein